MKKEKNIDILNRLKLEMEELNKKYDHDKLELTYYNVKETVINFFEKHTIEEQRTSLIRIINNCQIFNKYIVVDTGKILFIFNSEEEYILTEGIYNNFKKDKNFKNNFLYSSELLDENDEVKDDVIKYVMKFFYNLDNKKYDGYNWNKHSPVTNFLDTIFDYLEVRSLGNMKIESINIKNKDKIDMKVIMKKKLGQIGIDYDISKVDKIVSFTGLFWNENLSFL